MLEASGKSTIYYSLFKCTIDIFSTINGLETFHLLWPKINVTVAALAHSDMKTDKTSQQNMAIA